MTDELTDRDRAILELEGQHWRYAGAKEQAVRERFDMNMWAYYQTLNGLLDREDALAHDPLQVKRLRRLRAQRQRTREARRLSREL